MQALDHELGTVEDILPPAKLNALQREYRNKKSVIAQLAMDMFNTMYPSGRELFNPLNQRFFDHTEDGHERRQHSSLGRDNIERTIITLFASQRNGPFLAIHMYWGLLEGLTVGEMAETLLLVGTYTGIGAYTQGLTVLSQTLTFLANSSTNDPVEIVRGLLTEIKAKIVS